MSEGYKLTELGEIPQNWEVVNLNSLLVLLTDFEANGSFADVKANVRVSDSAGYAWYVRATDLENKTSLADVKYVDEKSYVFLRKTKLNGGELLITKRGEIGKVYFFDKPSDVLATLAPNLYLLKLNGDVVPKYLYYYFISDKGNASLKRINASTTLGALYKDDVKKLKLPLPPFKQQQKIVEVLSTIDEKINVIEAQITQTTELKKGLMQQLLTKGIGHTTFKDSPLGEIPESWQIVKVNNLLKLLTDFEANGSFADVKANVTVKETKDYAWYVRATDLENKTDLSEVKYVDEKSYKFLRKTSLEGGELLITKRGEIGKVYFFNMPENMAATLAPNLYLLKLNEHVLPKFLYYHFLSVKGNASLKRINASTTLGALYKDDVKKLQVPLPDLNEQQKIVEVLTTIDHKIETLCTKKSFFIDLKKGLMQQLLTGKIRVNQTNSKHDATKSQHVQAAEASV